MPPPDRTVNQKFSDMRLNTEERLAEESAAFENRISDIVDADEASSIPAVKIEKNEPPLLHKGFFNDFIDFFDPFRTSKLLPPK